MIGTLLQVSPVKRPTCQELLTNPMIKKFSVEIDKLININYISPRNVPLLSTIKLPRNIRHLSKHLPSSNYGDDDISVKSATMLPIKAMICKLPNITSKSDPGCDDDNLSNFANISSIKTKVDNK